MKTQDYTLLNEIKKNTELAMLAIDTLLPKSSDDMMYHELERQNLIYSSLHDKAVRRLVSNRQHLENPGKMTEWMMVNSLNVKTLLDVSSSHIAELMMQGSNMGLTSVVKQMNHTQEAGKEIMETAQELACFEEDCLKRWKEFL